MATCTRCCNPLKKQGGFYVCRRHGAVKKVGLPTYQTGVLQCKTEQKN